MDMWEEWQKRRAVLDEALKILSSGHQLSGRDIAKEISARGIQVEKRLINSILFSEGRRYVFYDRESYTYRIRDEFFSVPISKEPESSTGNQPLLAGAVELKRHYVFEGNLVDSSEFFRADTRGGRTVIVINRGHPFYGKLATLNGTEELGLRELSSKFEVAKECIWLMIQAWSEYESDQPEGKRLRTASDARIDWGRKLRNLLSD